jgi:hypothetical protein
MPNALPVPDALQHLLEKRETSGDKPADRRKQQSTISDGERRSGQDRRQSNSSAESADGGKS